MAACWKDFISHLVLESHHQEVLGQVAGDEDIWAPLACKLPLTVPPLAKGQKWMDYDGEDECLFSVLTVCPSACLYVKHEDFWSDHK